MPAKYHIHTKPMRPRRKPIGKYGIVDWREDCSSCHNCVKRECAYSVYDQERDKLRESVEYVDYLYECKGCLCCVQSCTKGLLSWSVNPEYESLGDEVWTPDIISSTWYQAETGRIPVSGAGYPGPFRGPGFDSILTDMSEIVRPTRDGIHGREYISTSVDIGCKPLKLDFGADGNLLTDCPALVEIPLPVMFNLMPWHAVPGSVTRAMLDAAKELGVPAIIDEPSLVDHPAALPHLAAAGGGSVPKGCRIAEWAYSPDAAERIAKARSDNPELVVMVKVPLGPCSAERALELSAAGVDAIHLFADWRGYVDGRHISELVREVHLAFVESRTRDAVTLIASGGISMAEHVAKSILCGADLVAVDVPLMIALECRVCENCRRELKCPVDLASVDHDYAVQRIVNLMGAWHSQLLEMMGAMGIREVRRLRGEVGRAMFFDDLERECFGPVFGERKVVV
ncbi:MAG: hypothetical protein A2Z18_00810 [Armatimonadetes bacterium RBG_16_58_9]|nr:MAG: hypothetical protein A2Z18_00810 [Armatimonadetes bacterium RBG_16_58_9]